MRLLSNLAQTEYDYSQYETMFNETSNQMAQNGAQVSEGAAAAALVGLVIFGFIAAVIGYVINAFLLSRIFKKAGVEEWKAWVPIYNTWIMLELGDQKGWWAVVMLVPFVNIVALVFILIAAYNIGLKLEKEGVFVLLAIFLPIVWLAWLGFDKSTWKGAKPAVAAAGVTPTPTPGTAPKPSAKSTIPPKTTPPTA